LGRRGATKVSFTFDVYNFDMILDLNFINLMAFIILLLNIYYYNRLPDAVLQYPIVNVLIPKKDDIQEANLVVDEIVDAPYDVDKQCGYCKCFLPIQNGLPDGFDLCSFCGGMLCTSATNQDIQEVGKNCGMSDGYIEITTWGEICKKEYRYCNGHCWNNNFENEKIDRESWALNVRNAKENC
jgi:hypothetical protein